MARYPGAQWRPLAPNYTVEGRCYPTIVCLHTMVGSLWGTDSYFMQNGYGGTESHFGVGYDGTVIQWQDTLYQADANLDGNDRVISIETADKGTGFPAWTGSNVPAWTNAQRVAIAKILKWCSTTHGIPLTIISNTSQSSKGIGYHRQGIDPWRCSTCERWSAAYGKVCPGDRRVAQIPGIIALARGEEDSVTQDEFDVLMSSWWNRKMAPMSGAPGTTELLKLRVAPWHQLLGSGPLNMHNAMGTLVQLAQKNELAIEGLSAAVAALSTNEDLSAEEMTNIINTAIADAVVDVNVTVKDETP